VASGLIWHFAAFVPFCWWCWLYLRARSRLVGWESSVLKLLAWPNPNDVPLSLVRRSCQFLAHELSAKFGVPVEVTIPEPREAQNAVAKLLNLNFLAADDWEMYWKKLGCDPSKAFGCRFEEGEWREFK
jgi:hypothetical protein